MRNKRLIIILSIVASLVLVIIVCGATFLVRDIQAYSYYVDSPKEFDAAVISASGIEKNSSMFFLDEKKIKSRIENKCSDLVGSDKRHYGAEVINIERRFPDKVSINYVVYSELFQYIYGDKYIRCFASGKVSRSVTTADSDFNDFMTIKPRNAVSDSDGEYYQATGGYDRIVIDKFIEFMHSVRVNDKQMPRWIDFIDNTRIDGHFVYLYIRTREGCAIELRGVEDGFIDDLPELLRYGWSAFADPSPELTVNPSCGKISVYIVRATPDKPEFRLTYDADYSDDDYRRDYAAKESA